MCVAKGVEGVGGLNNYNGSNTVAETKSLNDHFSRYNDKLTVFVLLHTISSTL